MSSFRSRLAGVGLGALLAIGVGGAGLAYAQTTEETPSTTAPDSPASDAPAADDPDCPEKAGGLGRGRGGGRAPAPAPNQAPSGDPAPAADGV
ncbi:MAG: hypothetical protein ACRDYV_18585 [Acidimicrobiia bacterium]